MTIRRLPADFVVEEVIRPGVRMGWRADPGPEHPVTVYRLEKTSLTTPEAIARLAKAAIGRGVARAADRSALPEAAAKPVWQHAGLKDKHAVTAQHVSVRGLATAPERVEGPGVRGERIGYTRKDAHAGWIAANRFRIVVRGLSGHATAALDAAAVALSGQRLDPGRPARFPLINYFGDQRFGSARHGSGFACRALMDGDFLEAVRLLIATPHRKDSGLQRDFTRLAAAGWGDWARLAGQLPPCPERGAIETLAHGGTPRDAFAALPFLIQRLCVEAYQSWLWNRTARAWVHAACRHGDLVDRETPFGLVAFVRGGALPVGLVAGELPTLTHETVPVWPWGEAASTVLCDLGLAFDRLRVPGLRRPSFDRWYRPLCVPVREFTLSPPEPDELAEDKSTNRLKRTLAFDLPSGAYATTLLRALGH